MGCQRCTYEPNKGFHGLAFLPSMQHSFWIAIWKLPRKMRLTHGTSLWTLSHLVIMQSHAFYFTFRMRQKRSLFALSEEWWGPDPEIDPDTVHVSVLWVTDHPGNLDPFLKTCLSSCQPNVTIKKYKEKKVQLLSEKVNKMQSQKN